MKKILLDLAWWSLTLVLLSYIVLVVLLGVLFIWHTPTYTKMISALDGVDTWRRSLPIFKKHFGVEE